MSNIIKINKKNDEMYERNKKLLEKALEELKDKDISSFVFVAETKEGQASFTCVADSNILTFTQGYLNHLFLDQAYRHLENAEDMDTE